MRCSDLTTPTRWNDVYCPEQLKLLLLLLRKPDHTGCWQLNDSLKKYRKLSTLTARHILYYILYTDLYMLSDEEWGVWILNIYRDWAWSMKLSSDFILWDKYDQTLPRLMKLWCWMWGFFIINQWWLQHTRASLQPYIVPNCQVGHR